jgi:hypothetical protein
MSIATLKRKTQVQYNNMSVGSKNGFSLNGTHRSQGYIGQTSLSRSLPKTIMKGNVACGNGGCCGKYNNGQIIQSAVISLNNPNVVKPSVIGTSGLISTKYRWINRPYPFTSVKQDTTHIYHQSTHTSNIVRNVLNCPVNVKKNTKYCNYDPYFRRVIPTIAKFSNPNNDNILSYDDYMINLNKKCTIVDPNPTSLHNTPFGCNNV